LGVAWTGWVWLSPTITFTQSLHPALTSNSMGYPSIPVTAAEHTLESMDYIMSDIAPICNREKWE
jgi:hypothetical protein